MGKTDTTMTMMIKPLRRGSHLFKTDRPRAIDRYIDYFGARHINAPRRSAAGYRVVLASSWPGTPAVRAAAHG